MSSTIGKLILLVLIVAGLYFFFRPKVLFLDFFDGKVVDLVQETFTATKHGKCVPVTEYSLVIERPEGEVKKAEVRYLDFVQYKVGMRVSKKPLSSRITITY